MEHGNHLKLKNELYSIQGSDFSFNINAPIHRQKCPSTLRPPCVSATRTSPRLPSLINTSVLTRLARHLILLLNLYRSLQRQTISHTDHSPYNPPRLPPLVSCLSYMFKNKLMTCGFLSVRKAIREPKENNEKTVRKKMLRRRLSGQRAGAVLKKRQVHVPPAVILSW